MYTHISLLNAMHYVHFVKYDNAVSFYDAVSDTIRRRGGNRGIFTEEGVDTVHIVQWKKNVIRRPMNMIEQIQNGSS